MKPEEMGRRFGIGVRVAGRIARQRIETPPDAANPAQTSAGYAQGPATGTGSRSGTPSRSQRIDLSSAPRVAGRTAQAAGRGVAGFLKPFRRVGGILWLEVTGFFFGLFAAAFAINLWRVHQDYAQGPHHRQFLIAATLTAVFAYLSISAFWRARRK